MRQFLGRVTQVWITAAVLAGVTSCEDKEVLETKPVFPLSLGNRWIYDAGMDSIIAVRKIAGHEYFQLSGPVMGNALVRNASPEQVVFWDGTKDQVMFDFALPAGSSWDITWDTGVVLYTVTVADRDLQNIQVPAGEFSGCYLFSFDSRVIDGDWSFVVAPEVGVVFKMGGLGIWYGLVSFDLQDRHRPWVGLPPFRP